MREYFLLRVNQIYKFIIQSQLLTILLVESAHLVNVEFAREDTKSRPSNQCSNQADYT